MFWVTSGHYFIIATSGEGIIIMHIPLCKIHAYIIFTASLLALVVSAGKAISIQDSNEEQNPRMSLFSVHSKQEYQ